MSKMYFLTGNEEKELEELKAIGADEKKIKEAELRLKLLKSMTECFKHKESE